MAHKRGSIIYMMMILIFCSTILVRSHRLFRSHVYLERGIYSMDVRVHEFEEELEILEEYLCVRFAAYDEFTAYMKAGRKISYDGFTIEYDSSYNKTDVMMILIVDVQLNYLRKVLAVEENGLLKLISKGV